jgi:hypothetical protein
MPTDSPCNTKLKSRDATTKSYSAIDVASFDPLITDVVLIEELAFALAPIVLPPPIDELFSRIFRTSNSGEFVGVDAEYCNALDSYQPSRIYRNALQQIFQSKDYRLINAKSGCVTSNAKYGLIDWSPVSTSSKSLKSDRVALMELALKDIGNRIRDLALASITPGGAAIAAVELTDPEKKALDTWDATVTALIEKAQQIGNFERRLNRIAVVTPLGLMHRYRQHFFYADLQKGRCELIRSLAPYETLEVVTTEEKVTTTEETVVKETEITTNQSREQKDSTELTDRVANTVARTSTTNMSANGSYTAVLWSAGGSASSTTSESSSKTSERIAKTLNDITQKQSEQIRKKTTISTRIAETRSDSITTRHTFQNPTEKPVTYGLYKLGYEVKSVIQDLGALLVWQTRIEKPGRSLASSDLIDKQIQPAEVKAEPLVVSITLQRSGIDEKGFSIDVSEALEIAFKNAMAKVENLKPLKEYQQAFEDFYRSPATEFKFKTTGLSLEAWYSGGAHGIPVNHSSYVVQAKNDIKLLNGLKTTNIYLSKAIPRANYFYLYATVEFQIPKLIKGKYIPDRGSSEDWTDSVEYKAKLLEIESILNATLTPRDRASLYFEERKTILANKIATLMQRAPVTGSMSDEILMLYLKINEIFDVGQLFYDVDTFEYQEAANLATLMKTGRPNYPLISKSQGKAPTGASLGWKHQVDGDTKRDMFLNAPFAWACLPVRPGKENDAVEFLREQNLLFGTSKTTTDLLKELEVSRAAEALFQPEEILVTAAKSTQEKIARNYIDDVIKAVDNSIDTNTGLPSVSIEDALASWKENKTIDASDVYPNISVQSTFVTIDGLAFQAIDMGVANLLDLATSDDRGCQAEGGVEPATPATPAPSPPVAAPTPPLAK